MHLPRSLRARLAVPALCVLLAASLAACGGSSGGSSNNGVASKSASGIVQAAVGALKGVRSVHVSGSLVSSGVPLTLDLSLVSGKGGTGSMSENGLAFQVVTVNNLVYIKGSDAFWSHFGGATAASLFHGKWLKAPATGQFAALTELANTQALFNKLLSSHGKLVKGSTTTINGQPAIAVTDSTQGGTLYVATTGKPYPIELVKKGSGGGRINFDRFNQPVSLTAPSGAIDASKLTG